MGGGQECRADEPVTTLTSFAPPRGGGDDVEETSGEADCCKCATWWRRCVPGGILRRSRVGEHAETASTFSEYTGFASGGVISQSPGSDCGKDEQSTPVAAVGNYHSLLAAARDDTVSTVGGDESEDDEADAYNLYAAWGKAHLTTPPIAPTVGPNLATPFLPKSEYSPNPLSFRDDIRRVSLRLHVSEQ